MEEKRIRSCSDCGSLGCRSNDCTSFPDFCLTSHADTALLNESMQVYANKADGDLTRVSAGIEAEYYCKLTRVEETLEFIRRMGFRKVGIASCVGLMREARIFARLLDREEVQYRTVGCKIGAVDKSQVGIPTEHRINKTGAHESMCNPVMQARSLDAWGSELNIVIGLCVGHDSLFIKSSKAPVTVMIIKDRVLGHNPVQALYMVDGMYSRFKK